MAMIRNFNCHINWKEMEGERKEDRKFMEMVNDTFLQQYVEEITWEGSKCILDLVLTKDETLVNKVMVRVGERFNRSDHQIIRWSLSIEPFERKVFTQKLQLFQRRL